MLNLKRGFSLNAKCNIKRDKHTSTLNVNIRYTNVSGINIFKTNAKRSLLGQVPPN